MTKERTLSAVLLLLLSNTRAAPLQDFINDDAVHSVVENVKQVLVASRHGEVPYQEEPDVLPIIDDEPVTEKSRNISVNNAQAVEDPIIAPPTVLPMAETTSVVVSPTRKTEIHDKVLDVRYATDRTSNYSQSHLKMTSISDKIQPLSAIYHDEAVAGSSIRVVSFPDPESMEQDGTIDGGGARSPESNDSGENSNNEADALMHDSSVPTNTQRGDDIEDVEMLDGSVPTKQGVDVNKLVSDEGFHEPAIDLSALPDVVGLVPYGHVSAMPHNEVTESDFTTTTFAAIDSIDKVVQTTETQTTTAGAPTLKDYSIDTDKSDTADVAVSTKRPTSVESNTPYDQDDVHFFKQSQADSSTIQPTPRPQTTIFEPTTINERPDQNQLTTSVYTTRTFQEDALYEQRATTELSTTHTTSTEQSEITIQERPAIFNSLQVPSFSEENTFKDTADETLAQNYQLDGIALHSTQLPQILDTTSTILLTTSMSGIQPTNKPEDVEKTPKTPFGSNDTSLTKEDTIRFSDSLPERLINNIYSDTVTGQHTHKEEFPPALPATISGVFTDAVVTEKADGQNEHNGEAAEESAESQEESQEANEELHETPAPEDQIGEQSGEQTGETGGTTEQEGLAEQSGESNVQAGGTSEHMEELSTEQPVPVETSTQVMEASSPSVSIEGSSEANGPIAEALAPIVVKLLSAHSQISLRYARTLVLTQLRNDAPQPQEARITVELPDDAFITGMTLESNGQVYRARVAERQAAKHQYQEAVHHGQSAAQVIASGRNTNVFSVLVSVEPHQILGVNLTYEELLARRRGRYHHSLTLRADQVIEKTNIEVVLVESRNLTALAVSAGERQLMSAEDRELALAGLSDLQSGLLRINRLTWKSAIISLMATGSQQQSLWGTDGSPHQVTVAYEVDRGTAVAGELLLMDGYFVHFFAPTDLPPLRKHAILVLDTSGSMWGRKLLQVQHAMIKILDSLHPDDYFSIVQFASQVTEWSPHTLEVVGLREKEATLPATREHISKAKKFISSMEASGGTNIGGALRSALKLAAGRDFDRWAGHGGSRGSPPQPLIIFLSDGMPTVGILSASRILAATRAANGELRASIFSLSFGSRSNWRFLQKLSLQNHGFARRVYEAGDAAKQLHDFYREISSPLLTNVTFNYIVFKVNKTTVTKRQFPLLCDGSEIVVAGRYTPEEENQLFEAEVEGWGSSEGIALDEGAAPPKRLFRAQAENITGLVPPPVPPQSPSEQDMKIPGLLERLWAYLTIRQLLDRDLAEGADILSTNHSLATDGPHGTGPSEETHRLRALYLALKYDFVTPLTSLIVVKPSNKPGGMATEILTDPGSDLDGVADDGAPHAEDFPMQNKISEMNLAKPGPDLPISFKPLLLGEDQAFNLNDIKWLPKHIDALGRLLVNGKSYNLQLPTNEELGSSNNTATKCSSGRTCQLLAKCVQADFTESYADFLPFFCPLGRWAGVCCSATF